MANTNTEIVFLYGWGPEEEGHLSSLLYMAETAASMNMNPIIFFFADASVLVKKGIADKIDHEIGRRMNFLIRNKKVKFYVCEQATRKRDITKDAIEEGITILGYAAFLDMATSAQTVITI